MININFFLEKRKKNKQGLVPIYMALTFNSQRIRKAVKEAKISEKDWIVKKQRLKNGASGSINSSINQKLEDLAEATHRINKFSLKFNQKLTKNFILKKLDNPDSIEVFERSFFKSFEEYLETGKATKAKRTITGHRTVMNYIQIFAKKKSLKLSFENIDYEFFELLRTYSFREKEITNNYFARIISGLKAFMNWSFNKGYHMNSEFKKFEAPDVEKEVIYLTLEELMRLYNHSFKSRKLTHVRDTYCFGCFTGLRFSDLIELSLSHIKENFISKSVQKTAEVNNKIPLNKYALNILEKYKNTIHEPLPKISIQKFNKYLKQCCEIVEINSPTAQVRQSGGKRIETIHPKWELITSHTARKTFVTNSLILGMKEMVIRNITGHKKEENFKKYVRIAEDFKQSEMGKTWDQID